MILPYRAGANTTAYDLAECVGKFCTTVITAVEDKNGVKCLLCIPSLAPVHEVVISAPTFYPYFLAGDST